MERTPPIRTALRLLAVAVTLLGLAALHAAAAVAGPVVIALLLCVALAPLDARLAAHLPDRLGWLSRVLIMTGLLAVLALFIAGLVFAAQQVLGKLPDLSRIVEDWIARTQEAASRSGSGDAGALASAFGDFRGALGDVARSASSTALETAGRFAEALIGATGEFVAGLVIVFFLVLLGLGEAGSWTQKIAATTRGDGVTTAWQRAVKITSVRLRRFIVVRTGIGILTAALYTGWLALFGIDLLVVWAVLALLLTFVPNLGSIISGSLPAAYALITMDFGTAVIVALGLVVIEQVIGNFLDPRLQGRHIALSPLAILVALLFWGWLWGAVGALLAVPITIALVAGFAQVPALRPVALMLSDRRDYAALDRALTC